MSLDTISSFLSEHPGPRLCIVNTVQTAAFIAQKLAFVEGRLNVEHHSTALTPNDREATLKRVIEKAVQGAIQLSIAVIARIEINENLLASKIGHNWLNRESYDPNDGSVADW